MLAQRGFGFIKSATRLGVANYRSMGKTKDFVSKEFLEWVDLKMASFKCGAHDYAHVERVRDVASLICKKEGGDQRITYVAALMHDMMDSKLVDEGENLEDLEKSLRKKVEKEMENAHPKWTEEDTAHVFTIVKSVGYKNMIRDDWKPQKLSLEYRCVQDADLLDAIGAIGVARCYAFGGKRNRSLFDLGDVENSKPTAEEYKNKKGGSGVEHFFEKLLLIKNMMTTQTGKEMAKKRHEHMVKFLEHVDEEINGEEAQASDDGAVQSVLGKRLRTI